MQLAAVHLAEATRCSTQLIALLRDPVNRLQSHFVWYWTQLPPRSQQTGDQIAGVAATERASVAFAKWLNVSLEAYGEVLHDLGQNGLDEVEAAAEQEGRRRWHALIYSLEARPQRIRWWDFFRTIGLVASERPSSFTFGHNGLCFVKGLLQSVYHMQLRPWLAGRSHRHMIHIVQSERIFVQSRTSLSARPHPADDEFDRLAHLLGLPRVSAAPSRYGGVGSTSISSTSNAHTHARTEERRARTHQPSSDVPVLMSSSKRIAPVSSPTVAQTMARMRSVFAPHNARLFALLEHAGQRPFDRALWG